MRCKQEVYRKPYYKQLAGTSQANEDTASGANVHTSMAPKWALAEDGCALHCRTTTLIKGRRGLTASALENLSVLG